MYTIAFIDRTNISLALPRISHDLHLDPQTGGQRCRHLLLGLSGLADSWRPPRQALESQEIHQHIVGSLGDLRDGLRFCAQRITKCWYYASCWESPKAASFRATLILLSHWFSRAERARANAMWLLCLPGAVVISSPFSGWVLDHWNWRSMLIAEGSLPFLWLIVWLITVQDHPGQAKWLPAAEREAIVATLGAESKDLETATGESYLRALLRPQVFLLAAVYFCFVSGQMGLLFWLPSAMGTFKGMSGLSTGFLFTLPFIAACIALILVGRHSDCARERRLHAAAAMAFGGCCILLAVATISYSLVLAFAFITLSGVGAYGPMGAFWAIPTETLPAKIVGSVMGFVNALGNLGAYFAPLLVGYLNKRTGNFFSGFVFLGLVTLAAGALSLWLKSASSPDDFRAGLAAAVPQKSTFPEFIHNSCRNPHFEIHETESPLQTALA